MSTPAWPHGPRSKRSSGVRSICSAISPCQLGYTEITKKWNDAETVRVQLTRVKENWPAFKARLQAQCYPFEKMRALFAAAGAPTDPSQIGVSREQLRSMVDFTQLLRWRINLLDLAKRARIYDELVARVFGKGGAWEIA